MEKLKMQLSYRYGYVSSLWIQSSHKNEQDYREVYKLIDNEGKVIMGLWIELYHSSKKQSYRICYYNFLYREYFKKFVLLSKDRNFTSFYTTKEEALEVATQVYLLSKA